jgi:hypothetical protein
MIFDPGVPPASVFANGSQGPPFSVTHTISTYRIPAPFLDTRSVRRPAALFKRRSRNLLQEPPVFVPTDPDFLLA